MLSDAMRHVSVVKSKKSYDEILRFLEVDSQEMAKNSLVILTKKSPQFSRIGALIIRARKISGS